MFRGCGTVCRQADERMQQKEGEQQHSISAAQAQQLQWRLERDHSGGQGSARAYWPPSSASAGLFL